MRLWSKRPGPSQRAPRRSTLRRPLWRPRAPPPGTRALRPKPRPRPPRRRAPSPLAIRPGWRTVGSP
eukprot:83063-Alexandrium_andersonii.AAC.1